MIELGRLDSALMALARAIASGDAAVALRLLAESPARAGVCFRGRSSHARLAHLR